MRWISGHQVNDEAPQLAALVGVMALLFLAAGTGMAYVGGFHVVYERILHARWWWLAPSFAAVVVAFAGYAFAYRGLRTADGGDPLDVRTLLAVVTAGFGGFFAQGGTALDEYAMRASGADKREAKVRVAALAGFEHGVLAMIVCPAAIIAWASGDIIPRKDFTEPWSVIPPIGFALGFLLAERYRDRLRGRSGWRGRLGVAFDSFHIVFEMLRRPKRYGLAVLGMLLYWAGDMFALWAATAAFGYQMSVLAVIVCLGTGMLFTRRTGPLGGAGVMLVALTATLWYGAAVPFSIATLGVAAYRGFTLWAPLPPGFLTLPTLRALGEKAGDTPGRGTSTTKGEPALEH